MHVRRYKAGDEKAVVERECVRATDAVVVADATTIQRRRFHILVWWVQQGAGALVSRDV